MGLLIVNLLATISVVACGRSARCADNETTLLDTCVPLGVSSEKFVPILNGLGTEGELLPIPEYLPDELAANPDLIKTLEGVIIHGPYLQNRGGTVVVSVSIVDGRVQSVLRSPAASGEPEALAFEEEMTVEELVSVVRRLQNEGYIRYIKGIAPDAPVYSLTEISIELFAEHNAWLVYFPHNQAMNGSDTFEVYFDDGRLREIRGSKFK